MLNTLTYAASALLAVAIVVGLIALVFLASLLGERAIQAHRRGMDRVASSDKRTPARDRT